MEQQLAFPDFSIEVQKKRTFVYYYQKWLYAFFAADRSPDNRPVIDIQRRTCWAGIAIILQALNQIDMRLYMPYVPFLKPLAGLIPFFLILSSFIAMWMVFRPATLKEQTQRLRKHPQPWQVVVLVCTLLTCIAGGVYLGRGIYYGFFTPPQYTNDGTSLDTNAAFLLLEGRNPYTDSSIVELVRRFPIQPTWTTPLREAQFANRLNYPTAVELRTVLDTDLKAGSAPEFESRVSYPSLSFLTLMPFAWLGIYNVLPFYLLVYAALIILGWCIVRPELRLWVVILALANVSMWTSVDGGNLDVLACLFVLLTWLLRERGVWSALCLGLAISCKQPTWFFVPFYIILVWRQYGFSQVVRRLSIAGGLALALNLPFILWNPQAWLAGVMAPVADPMFPMGVGIISFSFMPWANNSFLPTTIYTALEAAAMLLSLAWYWRLCKERPEAVMLLAVLPLFFAWRSLPSYFYCSIYPMFILLAARNYTSKGSRLRKLFHGPDRTFAASASEVERPASEDLPVPAGIA